MPIYGFKPNPKALAYNKAKSLYGHDAKVEITGTRPSPLDCKRFSIPTGAYHVECFVNGQCIATAHTKNWRKAYNLLVIEIEKTYEASLHRADPV